MINLKNLLLQIPEELHKKLKLQAVKEGTSMKEIAIKAIKKELKE